MADFATLGLQFDTASLRAGDQEMQRATRDAKALGAAVDATAASTEKAAAAFKRTSTATEQMADQVRRAGRAAGDFDSVHQRMGVGVPGIIAAGTAALGLFGLGFHTALTAAGDFYNYLFASGPKIEATIKEQARLLGLIKDAFKDAGDGAGKYFEQTQSILILQTSQMINELQGKIREESARIAKGLGQSILQNPMGDYTGMPDLQLDSKLEPFKAAITELNDSIAAGAPAMDRFRDSIADIGNSDPAFAKIANGLLRMSQQGSELVTNLREMEAGLAKLQGRATTWDNDRLGIKNPMQGPAFTATPKVSDIDDVTNAFNRQIASLSRRNVQMLAPALSVQQSSKAQAEMRQKLLEQQGESDRTTPEAKAA